MCLASFPCPHPACLLQACKHFGHKGTIFFHLHLLRCSILSTLKVEKPWIMPNANLIFSRVSILHEGDWQPAYTLSRLMECSPLLFGSLYRALCRFGLCKRYPLACIHGNKQNECSQLCRLGLCNDLLLSPPFSSSTTEWRPAWPVAVAPRGGARFHSGLRRRPHALEFARTAGGGGPAQQSPSTRTAIGHRRSLISSTMVATMSKLARV
jgi:hypothetical protein